MIDHKVLEIAQDLLACPKNTFFEQLIKGLNQSVHCDFSCIIHHSQKKLSQAKILVSNSVKDAADVVKHSEFENLLTLLNSNTLLVLNNNEHQQDLSLCEDLKYQILLISSLLDDNKKLCGMLICGYRHNVLITDALKGIFSLFACMANAEYGSQKHSEQLKIANDIIAHAHEALVIASPDGIVQNTNEAFNALTGFNEDSIVGTSIQQLICLHQTPAIDLSHFSNASDQSEWSGEIWINHFENATFPAWLLIKSVITEHSHHLVLSFTDLTEQKKAQEKIQFQENYDRLTQLANRSLFLKKIEQAIQKKNIAHQKFAVMIVDLDNFNDYNDSFSHSVGDELLIEIGYRLTAFGFHGNTVARLGGDEFALLMHDIHSEELALEMAKQILDKVHSPILISNDTFNLTACIGISLYPKDGQHSESLLSHADQALHSAKNKNRHSFQLFTQEMQTQSTRRAAIKSKLQKAIEKKSFHMMYQPIINIKQQRVVKFEALARWEQDGEIISPIEFIPIAEESGLIRSLGQCILKMSCEHLKELHHQGYKEISVTINRSVKELPEKHAIFEDWMKIIKQYGLPPQNIEFEITESVLAPEHESQIFYLNSLQTQGVKIAIDDFGTGYSSLSYLKRFSANVLKIDRTFIAQLESNKDDQALVTTIINLANSMNLEVVAEGVENKEQLQILSLLGCEYAQGYYLSKPLTAENSIKFLDIINTANLKRKMM